MKTQPLIFHDDAPLKMRRGVDALEEVVNVTMGQRECTVVLERKWGPPQLQNAAPCTAPCTAPYAASSAASCGRLILTTDCMIATVRTHNPAAETPAVQGMGPLLNMF